MQANDFYRGVLFEIKEAAVTPATPSIKPAPSTTPNTQLSNKPTTPFNFNVKLDAPQQKFVGDINANKGTLQPYINKGEQYVQGLSSLHDFKPKELEHTMFNSGVQNVGTSAIQGFGKGLTSGTGVFGGLAGAAKGAYDGIQNTSKVRQMYDTFKSYDPEHQMQVINEVAANDPSLAQFLKSQINRGITEHVQGEDFGGVASDIMKGVAGPDKGSAPSYSDVVMRDQNVKNFAKDALMGRAGQLTGDFLKNNWGKLSAVIGGAGLVALIYSLMKGRQQEPQQPQMAMPQQSTGPQFL